METLTVVVALMMGTLLIVPVARKIRLPYPVLVTVLGLAMALIPGIPELDISPELILPLFLPPLLYATAQRTSWRQFTDHLTPILLLAVALIFVTVACVAFVAHSIIPGLPLAAAVALGAIVAPPDPVAAVAVAGPLRLPRRLIGLLEGEGLFNDATALVIYKVAVAATVTGTFAAWETVGLFAYATIAAVIVALVVGWLAQQMLARITDATVSTAVTLIVPFIAYLAAEHIHASGVIAVVSVALHLTHFAADEANYAARLRGRAFWDVLEMLVTGLAFGLIGLQLRGVLDASDRPLGTQILHAVLIAGVVLAVRAIWIFGMSLVAHQIERRRMSEEDEESPVNWREAFIVAWVGMRGVATLATALALPLTFPARSELLLIAFTVILVTLVLQGLSLPWLVRTLKVQAPSGVQEAAERALALRAAKAAAAKMREIEGSADLPDDVLDAYHKFARDLFPLLSPDDVTAEQEEIIQHHRDRRRVVRGVQSQLLAAARAEVVAARSAPGTDPEVVDHLLHRLDMRSSTLAS